jgi:hypothetical protein
MVTDKSCAGHSRHENTNIMAIEGDFKKILENRIPRDTKVLATLLFNQNQGFTFIIKTKP